MKPEKRRIRSNRLPRHPSPHYAAFIRLLQENRPGLIRDAGHLLAGNIGDATVRKHVLRRLAEFPGRSKMEAWVFTELARLAWEIFPQQAIAAYESLPLEARSEIDIGIREEIIASKLLFATEIAEFMRTNAP